MDIDISDFSKKARNQFSKQIVSGPIILAGGLFCFFLIAFQLLINYMFHNYTGFVDPSQELLQFRVVLAVGIAALFSLRLRKTRINRLMGMDCFPVCYECGHRREESETECPVCGFKFKIKKIDQPQETISGVGKKYLYYLLLLMLITSPCAAAVLKVIDAWSYRQWNHVSKTEMNEYKPGSMVKYHNAEAKIVDVVINKTYHVAYIIDVNGQKVYGVAAAELQKVDIPKN